MVIVNSTRLQPLHFLSLLLTVTVTVIAVHVFPTPPLVHAYDSDNVPRKHIPVLSSSLHTCFNLAVTATAAATASIERPPHTHVGTSTLLRAAHDQDPKQEYAPPPSDNPTDSDYLIRRENWANRYTSLQSLRDTFGTNKNRLWGDLDAASARRLYKTLLPKALLELVQAGVQPEDLAPLAYQARVVAKLYARERCQLPSRILAAMFDGFRTLRRYGRFQVSFFRMMNVGHAREVTLPYTLVHRRIHSHTFLSKACGNVVSSGLGQI